MWSRDSESRGLWSPPVGVSHSLLLAQALKVPYAHDSVPGTSQPALRLLELNGHQRIPANPTPARPSSRPAAAGRQQYSLWTQEPLGPEPPVRVQQSDFTTDRSQRHVLANLQELGRKRREAMFILSQLNFSSYLRQPAYAAAAAAQLPHPQTLPQQDREGDFDVLLFHRHHGVLVGEVKAVGHHQDTQNLTQAQIDAGIANRLGKAVKQLNKSGRMVRHLVSDIAPSLTMRKTLFLPYLPSATLQRVLGAYPQLEQALCHSVGATSLQEAIELCCCADQLSDPVRYWEVTTPVLSRLEAWWEGRVACSMDPQLTDDLYLDIVARFVGPATTVYIQCNVLPLVEVRTEGEAVAELGRQLARLVLTLQQIDILTRSPRTVCITGPPGTGKTLVLVLQGLRWLRQGHRVHVVSTGVQNLAAAIVVHHQLHMTLLPQTPSDKLQLHVYDFLKGDSEVDRAVRELSAAMTGDKLHVLLDEACFSDRLDPTRLLQELSARVPDLHVWATSLYHASNLPAWLPREDLTQPLRSCPVVVREVQRGIPPREVLPYTDRGLPAPGDVREVQRGMTPREVLPYTDHGLPAPGDGLGVTQVRHGGPTHSPTGSSPVDCYRCGQRVAALLRKLGVGTRGNMYTNGPAPLGYSDVFVLTDSDRLRDRLEDPRGRLLSPASGFVQGLRNAGLPVCVRRYPHCSREELEDTALAITDQVTVGNPLVVSGLERKVVVWLRASKAWGGQSAQNDQAKSRLLALSRCTAHLIVVEAVQRRTVTALSCSVSSSSLCLFLAIAVAVFAVLFSLRPQFYSVCGWQFQKRV